MPAPIPSNVGGLFGYQFHQVAIFCPKPGGADVAASHWRSMGYTEWIEDNADLVGLLYGKPVTTRGRMLFNYDIMPMELEFLEYDGPSRHEGASGAPYISHMSVYVDDVKTSTLELAGTLGTLPFHRFITQNHTNPGVLGKKRFIESIFDTSKVFGYDIKLIQKVPWDYDDEQWLGATYLDL